jgi:hypothetical protein
MFTSSYDTPRLKMEQACRTIYKFVCRQFLQRKRNRLLMQIQEMYPEVQMPSWLLRPRDSSKHVRHASTHDALYRVVHGNE